MRSLTTMALVSLFAAALYGQTASVSRAYNYSTTDAVEIGINSIRGSAVGNDIDGDGKKEIAVTNYLDNGRVHIFEVSGTDSLKLVWSSPRLATGGGSTPRYVMFGDLDKDGKGEVIFQVNTQGILIFEWDGVVGSDYYGDSASAKITTPSILNATGNAEHFDIADVDADGTPELLIAYNASSNATDAYYVISAVGDYSTNDPGFSTFTVEKTWVRTDLTKWAVSGGSPMILVAAQLDGTGPKEMLLHNWNNKNIVPVRTTGANTYELSDTTNNKQNFRFGLANDDVALMGAVAYDIDKDGREEVYFPTYPTPAGGPHAGWLHMLSWNSGESVAEIDSAKGTILDLSSVTGKVDQFGVGYGDVDGNGKPNIYIGGSYPNNITSVEFQGGDKRDPMNWLISTIYAGEPTIYSAIRYRDSLGTKDTTYTINTGFVSKLYARHTDLDGDSKEDLILPYQTVNDSITIRTMTWNTTDTKWDTVLTKELNPKRWSLRVIEGSATTTGVEAQEWTVITPDNYILEQNYPNPFNPSTTIRFSLPVRERVSMKIYDMTGREVRTLLNNEERPAGASEVVWDGRNSAGQSVASGVYFYTLSWGNFFKTNKMTLVK